MSYEYFVTQPTLPPPELRTNPDSPMMNCQEMTWWMNDMSQRGWEFVSDGITTWSSGYMQSWWVFRRPILAPCKQFKQEKEA